MQPILEMMLMLLLTHNLINLLLKKMPLLNELPWLLSE